MTTKYAPRHHNECLYITDTFNITRESLANDVNNVVLLGTNVSARGQAAPVVQNYQQFKLRNWDACEFLLVQLVCTHEPTRHDFMTELYAHFLKFVVQSSLLHVKVNALYGLYSVYMTQPKRFQKEVIPVTCKMLQIFTDIKRACSEGLHITQDPIKILRRLFIQERAFVIQPEVPVLSELVHYMDQFDAGGKFPTYKMMANALIDPPDVSLKKIKEIIEEQYKPLTVLEKMLNPRHYRRYFEARQLLCAERPELLLHADGNLFMTECTRLVSLLELAGMANTDDGDVEDFNSEEENENPNDTVFEGTAFQNYIGNEQVAVEEFQRILNELDANAQY